MQYKKTGIDSIIKKQKELEDLNSNRKHLNELVIENNSAIDEVSVNYINELVRNEQENNDNKACDNAQEIKQKIQDIEEFEEWCLEEKEKRKKEGSMLEKLQNLQDERVKNSGVDDRKKLLDTNMAKIHEYLAETAEVKKGMTELQIHYQEFLKNPSLTVEDFKVVSEDKRMEISDSYRNAPNEIKFLVKEYMPRLIMDNTQEIINPDGTIKKINAYYSHSSGEITIDEDRKDFIDTFHHEIGHFIDNQLLGISYTDEFKIALEDDAKWYQPKEEGINDSITIMFQSLREAKLLNNGHISDILSAVTNNSEELQIMYYGNGRDFIGHDNDYWNDYKRIKEVEIFADLFAIYSENDRNTVNFVENYFPNISTQFIKSIKGEIL